MRQGLPNFSVIIPTYNRPVQLSACLESLARQDYPLNLFEVIIVDDGSKTPLDSVVTLFADQIDIRLVRQSHAGPAAGRNAGAARANGEFLVFTDDDCMPAPDWLKTLAARFASTPHRIIGGRTLNALPDNPYSAASQLIIDLVYEYYDANVTPTRFFASNNLALPQGGFSAVGGFDPTFTTSEDRDLCDRWLNRGYRMTYAPEALVYHAHALKLRSFWRQHFNYGRGGFRFHQARARRGAGRFRPQLRFYLHLLRFLRRSLPQLRAQRAFFLGALLLVWQVANTAGFFWEGLSQSARRLAR